VDIARDVGLLAVAGFLLLTPRTAVSVDNYVLGPPPDREDEEIDHEFQGQD
jgi:hypothetical protein